MIDKGIVGSISATTIWEWLHEDGNRPWTHRRWIFRRDPQFEQKASRVLDLYARTWEGKPLGENDFVISADEKTSIPSRRRIHERTPPARHRASRVEHGYKRTAALAYLAALDVHRAKVFGICDPSNGAKPFQSLVDNRDGSGTLPICGSCLLIVDNGSSHRGIAACERLRKAWPNLTLVHTPTRASWLNQIEIYFSDCPEKGAHAQ